jgi:hypothetical protein
MFWGCFEPFNHCPKVGTKQAEFMPLTHKFAKRSCIGIFRNERTLSTPLDTKLMFWGHFEPIDYCTKVDAELAELVPLTHKFTKSICVLLSS